MVLAVDAQEEEYACGAVTRPINTRDASSAATFRCGHQCCHWRNHQSSTRSAILLQPVTDRLRVVCPRLMTEKELLKKKLATATGSYSGASCAAKVEAFSFGLGATLLALRCDCNGHCPWPRPFWALNLPVRVGADGRCACRFAQLGACTGLAWHRV